MDERDAPMPGIRSPQSARGRKAIPVGILPDMAAATCERIRQAFGRLLRFTFVAADHSVVEAVPMTGDALDARRRMDVRLGSEFGRPYRRNRMTGQTAIVLRRIVEVEEIAMLAVEIDGSIFDKGGDGPLPVIGIRSIVNVPSASEPRGHAPDLADTSRGRRRPAEVLAEDLFGPFAVVLPAGTVMTSETVDFGFPRNVPA